MKLKILRKLITVLGVMAMVTTTVIPTGAVKVTKEIACVDSEIKIEDKPVKNEELANLITNKLNWIRIQFGSLLDGIEMSYDELSDYKKLISEKNNGCVDDEEKGNYKKILKSAEVVDNNLNCSKEILNKLVVNMKAFNDLTISDVETLKFFYEKIIELNKKITERLFNIENENRSIAKFFNNCTEGLYSEKHTIDDQIKNMLNFEKKSEELKQPLDSISNFVNKDLKNDFNRPCEKKSKLEKLKKDYKNYEDRITQLRKDKEEYNKKKIDIDKQINSLDGNCSYYLNHIDKFMDLSYYYDKIIEQKIKKDFKVANCLHLEEPRLNKINVIKAQETEKCKFIFGNATYFLKLEKEKIKTKVKEISENESRILNQMICLRSEINSIEKEMK